MEPAVHWPAAVLIHRSPGMALLRTAGPPVSRRSTLCQSLISGGHLVLPSVCRSRFSRAVSGRSSGVADWFGTSDQSGLASVSHQRSHAAIVEDGVTIMLDLCATTTAALPSWRYPVTAETFGCTCVRGSPLLTGHALPWHEGSQSSKSLPDSLSAIARWRPSGSA